MQSEVEPHRRVLPGCPEDSRYSGVVEVMLSLRKLGAEIQHAFGPLK